MLRLRCFRLSTPRPQVPPQQYSVTISWNSRLNSSAPASARSTYSAPRTSLRTLRPIS